jgi:hypothetical protein
MKGKKQELSGGKHSGRKPNCRVVKRAIDAIYWSRGVKY